SFKRERSQQHITKAPDILNEIMSDTKQSAKHRIDSAKVLDSFSGNGPKDASEQDRILIRIDLGADTRAKGLESNPADVIEFKASVRTTPDPNNPNITPPPPPPLPPPPNTTANDPPPGRRGQGRPPASKKNPNPTNPDAFPPPLPGFAV